MVDLDELRRLSSRGTDVLLPTEVVRALLDELERLRAVAKAARALSGACYAAEGCPSGLPSLQLGDLRALRDALTKLDG